MSREATNKLFTLIDDGVLDTKTVVDACLSYMSESDVADMCRMNEFLGEDEDEDYPPENCSDCGEPFNDADAPASGKCEACGGE